MMRETRTLKGLFPDPKPPHRKNFIKENVKSLRRMEQLFNANKSAKDLKLPVLKQTKILNQHNGIGDNKNMNINKSSQELNTREIVENETPRFFNQKSLLGDQKNRKKSTFVLSNKKSTPYKVSKPSVNGNVRKSENNRNQKDSKTENRDALKAYSEGDVVHKKFNQIAIKNETDTNYKSQGVQTLDTNDLNTLYTEGIIKYPSSRSKETQKPKSVKGDITQVSENKSNLKLVSDYSINDGMDYIKLNKERISIASKLASQLNSSTMQQNYRVGVVPKYIKERKEALQKEEEAKAVAKHADCPSGHVPVPDNERKKTLSVLKKNYQEFVTELNMLPIRTDTLRSQQRKMEIEKQLTKLEEAIKIFSRPKVFVKVDS